MATTACISILKLIAMIDSLNPVKKRIIEEVDTTYEYVEQFLSGLHLKIQLSYSR